MKRIERGITLQKKLNSVQGKGLGTIGTGKLLSGLIGNGVAGLWLKNHRLNWGTTQLHPSGMHTQAQGVRHSCPASAGWATSERCAGAAGQGQAAG